MNPVGNRTTLTTYDADIIKSTEKIALALHGKKILNFAICREMARLNTPEKLDAMGFSSIKDYGKALFDAGVYVNPVIAPACVEGECLLRTTLMATHTEPVIDEAVDIIARVLRQAPRY